MSWLVIYSDDGDVYVMESEQSDIAYDREITNTETRRLANFIERLADQQYPYPHRFAVAHSAEHRPQVICYPPTPPRRGPLGTWLQLFPDGDLYLMEGGTDKTVLEHFETRRETLNLMSCLRRLAQLRTEIYPTRFAIAPPEIAKPPLLIAHKTDRSHVVL